LLSHASLLDHARPLSRALLCRRAWR